MSALLVPLLCFAQSDVTIVRPSVDEAVAARRAQDREVQPPLRGFRAPMLDAAGEAWPFDIPDAATDPRAAETARRVSKNLARDGLIPTLVRAVDGLDVFELVPLDGAERVRRLRAVGIPVDWLDYFHAPGLDSVVSWAVQILAAGMSIDGAIQRGSEEITFAFRPTIPGFEVATESGEHDIDCIRIQVGSPAFFMGEGDGGTVDVARQIVTGIENVSVVAGIQEANLERFLEIARGWKVAQGTSFTLVPQALPVSEWAQDDGKPGFAPGSPRSVVTLVPRYASRGELGAMYLPGDTFALEAFASTGRRVVQSPLLFQGGNLLPVLDARTGRRDMLVGEAEIARNRTLGLTQAQVLEAFRVEFGVERCIVLPATSFHVDYEVSVRSTPDGLVAFMNDTSTAARSIVECGIPSLKRAGALSEKGLAMALDDVAAGRWDIVTRRLTDVLSEQGIAYGAFTESFAAHFSGGPSDSGVAGLQRFVLAVDSLVAEMTNEQQIAELQLDPHVAAYLLSMRRRQAERQHTAQVLASQGFRIVGVPSLSQGARSLTTLNGVHARGVYYMPAYGGLYAGFDRDAQAAFEKALGPTVRVVPILCGESMRRDGALHCAVSILPRP